MKTIRGGIVVVTLLLCAGAYAGSKRAQPQPLAPADVPQTGNFYSFQGEMSDHGWPPLPFNPFAGGKVPVPVYSLGRGYYVYDDSLIDYGSQLSFKRVELDVASVIGESAVLTSLTMNVPFPGDEGGGGSQTNPPPDLRRNFEKFMGQAFSLVDTNDAATNDTNLYNACLSFPVTTNPGPNLQIARYGTNTVLIKANHFDYSEETSRDFALLVCDTVDKPVWKNVDLLGGSASQDGWLVQGLVSRLSVTDPMYLLVENTATNCNAFFLAMPYSGPEIQLTGAQPNDVVSNTFTLHAIIRDLSGATNQQLTLLANGLTPRYTVGASNAISIDTRYTPNGPLTLSANVATFDAIVHDPTNPPMDKKLEFDTTATLALDFENETYVYFSGDHSDPDIGTNYFLFGVTPPQTISATITEPASGRVLRSFSGFNPSYSYVQLDWSFTEVDGVTPYTNDDYVVSFTSTDTANNSTTLTSTNKIEWSGVRPAGWMIGNYEEVDPDSIGGSGSWINSEMLRWGDAAGFMYESLYSWDFGSQSQYFGWQIGNNRDTPSSPHMPFSLNPTSESGWVAFVRSAVTNRNYSDFNYGPGHGNGYQIGGGEYDPNSWYGHWRNYVNTRISAEEMADWVRLGRATNRRCNMRKVTMWNCWSARRGVYASWYQAFGISDGQMNTLSGKSAGLFFNENLEFARYINAKTGAVSYYGNPPANIAEVAASFEKFWVMGANPYPGGADPNYSFQFALGVTKMLFNPAFDMAGPVLIGCPYLPFAGVYDDQLMINDFSQVKP